MYVSTGKKTMTKQDKNDSGKTKSKTSQFLKGPLLSVCFLPSPTVSSQKHTHTWYTWIQKRKKREYKWHLHEISVADMQVQYKKRQRNSHKKRQRNSHKKRQRSSNKKRPRDSNFFFFVFFNLNSKSRQSCAIDILPYLGKKRVQLDRFRNTTELCRPKSRLRNTIYYFNIS